MFSIQEKATGKMYTQTATLLVLALVFIPGFAIFTASRTPIVLVFTVVISLVLCLWAINTWQDHSDATVLSIVAPKGTR